jgi:hypothetical protein
MLLLVLVNPGDSKVLDKSKRSVIRKGGCTLRSVQSVACSV